MSNGTFNTLILAVPALVGLGILAAFSYLDDRNFSLVFCTVILALAGYRIFIYHKIRRK